MNQSPIKGFRIEHIESDMSNKSEMGKTSSLLGLGEERMELKQELEETKKKHQTNKKPRGHLTDVPYLPNDCIFSILVRLPLESLVASRFTCKTWYGIVNDASFIDAHLQPSNIGLIYLTPAVKVQSSSTMKPDYNVDAKAFELESVPILPWSLFNPYNLNQIKYLEIKEGKGTIKEYNATSTGLIKAACNGLVVLESRVKERKLVIMNPVTRESEKIPLGTMASPNHESYGLAFCHQSSGYKLVHLFQNYSKYIGCEIMNIGSGSWRIVDGPSHGSMRSLHNEPVFAIGALHWMPELNENEHIVSMSLNDEKFHNVTLPSSGGTFNRILEMGGVLGFVSRYSTDQIDVWFLKSLGEGWEKKHRMTMDCAYMVPLCYVRGSSELVFNKIHDLYGYDLDLQILRKIEANNEWCYSPYCFFPHVNSLVSWRVKPGDVRSGSR